MALASVKANSWTAVEPASRLCWPLIQGYGESSGAVREEITVASVRLGRAAEAGVLAHGPEPAAVMRGMDAARERILARETQIAFAVPAFEVVGPVVRLGLEPRGGLKRRLVLFVSAHGRTGSRFQVSGARYWPGSRA